MLRRNQTSLKSLLRLGPILVFLSIAVMSISMIMPDYHGRALLSVTVMVMIAIVIRSLPALHITIFCFLFLGFPVVLTSGAFWPWPLLAPLLGYYAIVLAIPPLRRTCRWMKIGRIDKRIGLFMLIVVAGSASALYGWRLLMKPDMSRYISQIPDIPTYLLPIAGIGFALLNGIMEEVAFRGIIMHGFDSALNNDGLSILLQALPFGLIHFAAGFPNGISGIFLTFIYGILMGIIRNLSKGMLAPIVTHFFADLAIFSILASMLFGSPVTG